MYIVWMGVWCESDRYVLFVSLIVCFLRQKTSYEMRLSLVGSGMCVRERGVCVCGVVWCVWCVVWWGVVWCVWVCGGVCVVCVFV